MQIWSLLGLLFMFTTLSGHSVEFAEFFWREDAINHPLNIYWDGKMLRVDTPSKEFSVICDSVVEDYLGLENRDARFWHFSWPKLKATMDQSRQHVAQLKSSVLIEPSDPTPSPPVFTYVWKKSSSLKVIGLFHCQLWETTDVNQRRIALWCSTAPNTPSRDLWKNFVLTENRLQLVAVRSLGPSMPLNAFTALPGEAGLPIELIVGEDEDSSSMTLRDVHQINPDPALFKAPAKYELSPLSALDGIE